MSQFDFGTSHLPKGPTKSGGFNIRLRGYPNADVQRYWESVCDGVSPSGSKRTVQKLDDSWAGPLVNVNFTLPEAVPGLDAKLLVDEMIERAKTGCLNRGCGRRVGL